ncbi:CBS domain-containing protein [Thalassobius sp. Cn5-15]|jgi:CBS domain-containing protein|uniref:CBS domain-containing protein n=1 Tax=Thalassobius sp. Cn5-15 TaxID=2917763 RepID=UPI001EF29FFE|nr:CBS domain-containing protein [Thalassobius sp. Cn5-15]MCG7494246.1 CBS domain-containing protein [Thalassobius sp. Cn5-15]
MPTSYQPPTRGDSASNTRTSSQSLTSNTFETSATVADLLSGKDRVVHSVTPDDTLRDAVRILRDQKIGALVAVNLDGTLCGILSERDIVRQLAATEAPDQTLAQRVGEIMTHDVLSCTPEDTLMSVLTTMTDGRFRHMPVVEQDRLCGMITIGDAIQHRLKLLEHEALQLKQLIVG